jgi:hypothetical protein
VLFAAKSLELGVSRNLDSGRARVGLAPSIPATRPTNAPLQRLAAALYRTTSRPANAHPGAPWRLRSPGAPESASGSGPLG